MTEPFSLFIAIFHSLSSSSVDTLVQAGHVCVLCGV